MHCKDPIALRDLCRNFGRVITFIKILVIWKKLPAVSTPEHLSQIKKFYLRLGLSFALQMMKMAVNPTWDLHVSGYFENRGLKLLLKTLTFFTCGHMKVFLKETYCGVGMCSTLSSMKSRLYFHHCFIVNITKQNLRLSAW